ncbi:hypothetical protein HK104_002681 [Borealophlyctis nickersoniae]|nr:hypothetical protein HK104_002681 [Borealophlyctis nickersoniae]
MPRAADDEVRPEGVEEEDPVSFDGLKKKKKKKKVVPDFEEAPAADEADSGAVDAPQAEEAPVGDEDAAAMFADLKKKKKKKKVTIEGDEAPKDAAPAEEAFDASQFGEKKKKKKKKTDLAEFEAQLKAEGEEAGAEEETREDAAEKDDKESKKDGEEPWVASNRDYTYQELLSRVFKTLRQNNPELAGDKKRYTIVPPQVHRDGAKKSVFANVVDICKRMHRQPDHVIQYLFAELGTTGSIDGSQRLVIKGRFQQKQIEIVLKHYIMEYVTCKTCKSADTLLTKENRLFFLQCESCGSTRTVSAIKTGFMAQTQRRSAQRAAAGV